VDVDRVCSEDVASSSILRGRSSSRSRASAPASSGLDFLSPSSSRNILSYRPDERDLPPYGGLFPIRYPHWRASAMEYEQLAKSYEYGPLQDLRDGHQTANPSLTTLPPRGQLAGRPKTRHGAIVCAHVDFFKKQLQPFAPRILERPPAANRPRAQGPKGLRIPNPPLDRQDGQSTAPASRRVTERPRNLQGRGVHRSPASHSRNPHRPLGPVSLGPAQDAPKRGEPRREIEVPRLRSPKDYMEFVHQSPSSYIEEQRKKDRGRAASGEKTLPPSAPSATVLMFLLSHAPLGALGAGRAPP